MQTVRPPDASQGSGMVVDSQAVVRNNTLHPDPTKGTIDRQLQPRIRPVNLTSTWPTHRGRRAAALPALVWVCSQFRTVWSHAWAPESTTTATTQDPCTALPGHGHGHRPLLPNSSPGNAPCPHNLVTTSRSYAMQPPETGFFVAHDALLCEWLIPWYHCAAHGEKVSEFTYMLHGGT